MKIKKNNLLFYLALLLAFWFCWMGMIWVYNAALIIGYPAGIISLAIWFIIKKDGQKRNKIIPIVLSIGFIVSLSILVFLLIFD
jgi:hypothetical protein